MFCFEYERVVSNDRVVRFENRCLQLKPKRNQGVGAGARVTIQQWRDQSLHVRFEEHEIEHEVIATPTASAGNTRGLVSAFNNGRRKRLPIFLPPLQGSTLFSAYLRVSPDGSTLGYDPAAASRLPSPRFLHGPSVTD